MGLPMKAGDKINCRWMDGSIREYQTLTPTAAEWIRWRIYHAPAAWCVMRLRGLRPHDETDHGLCISRADLAEIVEERPSRKFPGEKDFYVHFIDRECSAEQFKPARRLAPRRSARSRVL
jgi:hypothetical protein